MGKRVFRLEEQKLKEKAGGFRSRTRELEQKQNNKTDVEKHRVRDSLRPQILSLSLATPSSLNPESTFRLDP